MANTQTNVTPFYMTGDGVSTTGVIALGLYPLSATFVSASAYPSGIDVSSNISSAVLSGSNLNITFLAAFSGVIIMLVNIVLAASASQPVPVAKGTQGATATPIQDLKDSGRNMTNYFMAAPIITTTAEVMQSLTGYKGGVAVGATVTPAVVTAGKTYRIQSITITYWDATIIGGARINLRANLSGVGIVSSPLVVSYQVGVPAAYVAGTAEVYQFSFPDGLEFAAGTGIAVGVIGEGAVPTTGTITGQVMVAIQGYEY
jgi:hypothetical protein